MSDQRKDIELGVSLALTWMRGEGLKKLEPYLDDNEGLDVPLSMVEQLFSNDNIPAIMQNVHLNEGLD